MGSTLGFFTRAANDLLFHEASLLLALALLETGGFTNHQQLMLLLDFYFRGVKHRTLPLPPRLVFALSIDMIGLCLSQYGYSFKENNGYSIFE